MDELRKLVPNGESYLSESEDQGIVFAEPPSFRLARTL